MALQIFIFTSISPILTLCSIWQSTFKIGVPLLELHILFPITHTRNQTLFLNLSLRKQSSGSLTCMLSMASSGWEEL